MTRGSRRTHLRDMRAIQTTKTMCGLTLPAGYLWRMRNDPSHTTCKRCRTKWDQMQARKE